MNEQVLAEDEAALAAVAEELQHFERQRSSLIPVLQMIQEKCGYLPSEAMYRVADHLDIAACDVLGVATFYNQFRFHPPGKHQVKVCLGTACHVKGGDIILENFERKLGIKEGETTEDREFSIDRVACVGCCALAPVAVVDETVHGYVAPSKVEGLIMGFQIQKEREERQRRKDERE